MRERTNNDLNTPAWIVRLVRMLGPIGLDPCSNPWSVVGAAVSFSLDEGQDGLAESWAGRGLVYVNPPYGHGHMLPWARKMVAEARAGAEILALVKGDFSTRWWDELRREATAVCYLRERVEHGGGEHNSGNFPSSIWYFGEQRFLFAHVFETVGDVRLL